MAVAYSLDGTTILTAGIDNTVLVWEAATGKQLVRPIRHNFPVRTLAFSPDGHTILTGSDEGTVRLWDAFSGEALGGPIQPTSRPVNPKSAFLPDGRAVLTVSATGARLWDVPPPVVGDIPRVVLWAQTLAGMELDLNGVAHPLTPQALHQRRQRLDELGGPMLP
jgi:hypothetical protein